MLIDGKLVDGAGRHVRRTSTRPPRTCSGEVADASKADMHRAIDAARRAFDETDWSTNRAFRKRCLEQLQEALEAEQEALREELILEAGCPRMVTHGPQLDAPLAERAHVSRQADRRVSVGDGPRRRVRRAHRSAHHAEGLARAGGRGRRDRAVELPVRGHDQQARSGAGHRQHGGAEAGAGHALQRDAPRALDRRAHGHAAPAWSTSSPRPTTSSARSSRSRRRSI